MGNSCEVDNLFVILSPEKACFSSMNQQILFSVVTITFNAEDCLQRTLDSVLMQSYPHIEHLIIDGASKDKTVDIAKAYAEKSQHAVRISSEPDRGLYDAMNKGLQKASGDYIIFMNAGDAFPKSDTLFHIANAAAKENGGRLPGVLYGETNWTDNDGNVIGKRNHAAPKTLTWQSFKHGMLVCHQAFYARTDIAKKFPYDLQYRHSADIDWCIRVMKESANQNLALVNVNEVIANYQREGQTTANHKASLKERFDIMCKYYGTVTTIFMHLWFVVRGVIRKFCSQK